MSQKYKIRYLRTAQKDLLEIFEYIKRDNPGAAESLLEQFDKAILNLNSYPKLGVIPKDDRLEKLGYRILIIDK